MTVEKTRSTPVTRSGVHRLSGVAWARPEGAGNTHPASDPPLVYTERGMP